MMSIVEVSIEDTDIRSVFLFPIGRFVSLKAEHRF